MAGLRLGPLLRYVDWERGSRATVWVESTRPCTAEVRCADGAAGTSPTFAVQGHHYALVVVEGLTPGSTTPYEVLLDGRRVWPPEDSRFPPSTITTPSLPQPDEESPVRVAFGSCRWAAPPAHGHDPIGPDALDTLAVRLAADPEAVRPDVLLLLGDQVYADETSPATQRRLAARRDLGEAPGAEVADYEEYTHLYDESWRDPDVRWLLSSVPSCMIFDDHDVIDDWNTSDAWVRDMRRTPWWHERIVSGLMSYWVYQHLGNLSPEALEADPVYAAVRAAPDGTEPLRAHAATADAEPARTRWSYRRVFGRVRLLMVDTRAARTLDEQRRAMLRDEEAAWLRDEVLDDPGAYDHLLIGTSLPWLLPPLIHDAETWNAALCRGARGERWARRGEKVRRAGDLEHWAAFPDSFNQLSELLREAGRASGAPATICVLSGDVHHAYITEPQWSDSTPDGTPAAHVLQLTCSPVHNSVPAYIRAGFRFGWSGAGRWLGRALAFHGRTGRPPMRWRKTGGPWFGNQLMTLTLHGRKAALTLVQARARPTGAQLETVMERSLTSNE
ncbi:MULTISPECIES: alkaline phosphatase D family protein [unclassified Streptomyces]|uniref:alkaline phosphatase D family protein n=1 Tax=unclassified Streptomyces TaxID=2593676 RepID=UPI002E15B13F|nr:MULTISPECIES: alkaline phosphatase D family protein [unclassified Streptomyces]WSQ87561.1 alkaline phosphatase family protein [Streptomyces sp. NBC_01212]WSR06428.1 alkaline phosphatase family protein [Streptomyces sp. NBC_01208]WSR50964.1 alkaline phosphatase family protein [Streptomyces sp. NBC_01201]